MDSSPTPPAYDHYRSTLSPTMDIGAGFYLLFITVFSIMGNLLVLVMAFSRSSRMKPPELLSVNLAVTDLGAAVTMYPLAVASAWSHRFLGGDAACLYYGLAGFFFGVASIMNLTVLAIVRFVVSMGLQSPKDKVSWRHVKLLCSWSWLYALVWALMPVLGWGQYGPEPFGLSCSLAWGRLRSEDSSFVVAMFSFNLALPAAVIVCCYFGIAIKLYVTYKKSLGHGRRIPNVLKMHRRLFTMAVLISLSFIVCWSPYSIVSMWSAIGPGSSIPPQLSVLPCMFAKSSTACNPVIYYIFSQSFKREVKQVMRCRPGLNQCCGGEDAERAKEGASQSGSKGEGGATTQV
ncbi:opsin 8, group member b [Syngnathoides biaculeatus]|uniref:opsin 8, group member b n=1 Tax=Syngnathoides biaculeatus TaxID=300417 RepID=UPI002ADDCBD9|nr:opsin 8, group member b [Syngnathoides biaculeatus]